MRWKKPLIAFWLGLLSLTIALPVTVFAEDTVANGPSVADFSAGLPLAVDSAMAIDGSNGQILFEQNAEELHGIASITKLLSLYVVYDQIAAGELSLETKIPISEEVSALSQTPDYANVPLEASDDFYTAEELIDATIVGSANAAIVALAEYIAGSEAQFVSLMKTKLSELGVSQYEIYTASGMSGNHLTTTDSSIYTEDQENQMRAKDVLFMARELITDYPELKDRAQQASIDFRVGDEETVTIDNFNKFLPGLPHARSDVFGLKTGTEKAAGSCIVTIQQIEGRDVYVVTLGANSDDARYEQTRKLMDYLANQLQLVTLQAEGQPVFEDGQVSVAHGNQERVGLAYTSTVAIFLPMDYPLERAISAAYERAWQYNAEGQVVVNAPLATDRAVNTLKLNVPFFRSLFNGITLENEIAPTEDVRATDFVVRITRIMSDMFRTWQETLFGT